MGFRRGWSFSDLASFAALAAAVLVIISRVFNIPFLNNNNSGFANINLDTELSLLVFALVVLAGVNLYITRESGRAQKQKLLENTERANLRKLFTQIPEFFCFLSGPEHRFEFVNESHIKVLGFDATGKTVREAQPDSIEVHGILDKVYQTGGTAEMNEAALTVGNRLRYFNLTFSPRYDASGSIDGIMILGTEVTNRVLRTSGYNLQREALEKALNGTALSDVLKVLVQMVQKQIGSEFTASIMIADNEKQVLNHGVAPGLPQPLNDAMQGLAIAQDNGSCGTAAFTKKTVIVSDISTDPLWFKYREIAALYGLKACWSVPILSSEGKLLGTFAIYAKTVRAPKNDDLQIIEIAASTTALILERQLEYNERIASTKALEESESRLSLALHAGSIGLWDWNAKTGTVYLSDTLMQEWDIDPATFKHTLEECLARIYSDDRERVWSEIQKSTYSSLPYDIDYRIVRSNGELVWTNAKGRYFLDENGKPERLTGITLNISERRKAAQELFNAKDEAERANTMKSSFLANMSHEIRTPLGAISGFVGLLKSPDLNKHDLADHVGVIERNATQLLRIIDDILDLSKVEAGKMQIEHIDFSLIELLADFSYLMGFKAKDKGITFELQVTTLLPDVINSDPTRLRQILSNVVGNAIKFTEKGEVRMYVSYNNRSIDFRVTDTGSGIAADQLTKLFQPFHQADISTTRKFGGTGLGLVLTRSLTEALNGRFVLLKSELGVGSEFLATVGVDLPATYKMIDSRTLEFVAQPRVEVVTNPKPLAGMKVLVVDDSPDNQVLFRLMLTKAGAKIEIASDGVEGVEKALSESFDVILLDVQMPRMDGHEATQELRAKGYTGPVIALTAHAMIEERERAIRSGYTDFLSKPVSRDVLVEMVGRFKSRPLLVES